MADEINLPNLVSHLQVDLQNTSGIVADATRQGSAVGQALGESLQRRVQAATNDIPPVEIDANSNGFDRDLDRVRRELQRLGNQRIGVDISIEDALRQMDRLEPHIERLARTHPDIDVRASVAEAAANLADIRAAATAVDAVEPEIDVHVEVHDAEENTERLRGALGRLSAMTSGLGGLSATLARVGTAVGSIVPVAAGAVAALQQMAPAAGLAATGVLGVAATAGTLKLAMTGVGDAVTAALDPEAATKYGEALAKLSPHARAFVETIHQAQPALDALRRSVQDKVFAGLDTQLKATASATLPALRQALNTSAGTLNRMAQSALSAARTLARDGTLGTALQGATAGMRQFSKLPGIVVQGLGQVGAAAAPAFQRLSKFAGEKLDQLSAKMNTAFKSGAMERAIETAVSLAGQLIHVAGNVADIFRSIFSAAQTSGGGFLGVISKITDSLKKAFAGPEVQGGLKSLFSTMSQLATTAGPLLGQALGVVGGVLQKLGPPAQTLIKALGATLQPVIRALGPLLASVAGAVGKLVVALAPLLTGIGKIVAALLPAIQPVFGALSRLFQSLAPVVTQLAVGLSSYLAPVLSGLVKIIASLIKGNLDELSVIFNSLQPMMPQIAKSLGEVGKAGGDLLSAIAPLLPQLTKLSMTVINQLLPAIVPLIPPIVKLASALFAMAVNAVTKYAIPALQKLITFISGLQKYMAPGIKAITWFVNKISSGFEWLYDHLVGHSVIPDMVRGIVSWLASLPGKALGVLASLPGRIASLAGDAAARFTGMIRSGMSQAVSWVGGLPGRIAGALGNLGGLLWNAGTSIVRGLITGIRSAIPGVQSVLNGLTNMIPDWKGPPRRDATLLTPAGKTLIRGLIDGIDASTKSLKSKLGQVTTLIERSIGINAKNRRKTSGLGSLLSRIERDNTSILRLAARRDAAAKSLAAATKKLTDITKERDKLASETKGRILGEANIAEGRADVNSVTAITVGLQQALKKTGAFANQIAALRKRGLRADLLQQITDAGVESGSATATALSRASAADLARINLLQSQLSTAAGKVGSTVADQMYGSGVRAAQGLVDGLKRSQASIERQMEKIAVSMVRAIKSKLKIHSPSRVFADIGAQTAEGLRRGMLGATGAVAAASGTLATAATRAASGVPAVGALSGAYAGAAAGSTNNTFNLYQTDASPDGILRALSWQGLVGRR
ncbi:hypothetical protein FCH28_09770 [Streptomyces piniterrae]|uniref:Phage tail protein n=1 Tax=Streptomyces piniterrae TaxID=2571125 RepID=A0A4U0NMI3_9ACTN|nr:hypothetical protein [Streptomyces piniterrae]TJZ55616.1 hypothetical protein FCH28_09770 [Streptomyces piniterrae]